MISQGFPLWAVDRDGSVFVVVGWVWRGDGAVSYPVLVSGAGHGTYVEDDMRERVFTFRTTDPTERPERTEGTNMAARFVDTLRQRMCALADDLENVPGGSPFARRIREELNR